MRISCIFLLLAVLPPSALAATYRWTDEHGQVHYSQVPPAGRKYDTVGGAPPPAAAPNQDSLNTAQTQGLKDEAANKEAAARKAAEKAQRDERCKRGLERLASIEATTAHRSVKKDEKGETVRLTQEEYEKSHAEAQKFVKENCD